MAGSDVQGTSKKFHQQFAFLRPAAYFRRMRKNPFEPCIATRGTKLPTGPDWIHEIKHDGYRLMVRRTASSRVSIRTRRGFDWSSR